MNLLILASIRFVVTFDYFAHLKQMKVVYERCQFILSQPMCPTHVKSRSTPKFVKLYCLVTESNPFIPLHKAIVHLGLLLNIQIFSMSHFFLKNQKLKFSFLM
jgi:hypothetical protein